MEMSSINIFTIGLIVLVAVVGRINGEAVEFGPCEEVSAACNVHEVRIVPCPEAEDDKPCKVKRGKTASIEFDYTTQWDSASAHGQVYSTSDVGDLEFPGMNTAACEHTSCPIRKSTKQTYTYTFPIEKKFPVKTYIIKWVLRNPLKPENTADQCCFTTKIKLVK